MSLNWKELKEKSGKMLNDIKTMIYGNSKRYYESLGR